MKQCEVMVKLISHTSLLKGDDGRLRKLPSGSRMCTMCELCSIEDANHMIMQCPRHETHRVNMHNEINRHYNLDCGKCTFGIILGGYLEGKDYDNMITLWNISSHHIYLMYKDVLSNRIGVG